MKDNVIDGIISIYQNMKSDYKRLKVFHKECKRIYYAHSLNDDPEKLAGELKSALDKYDIANIKEKSKKRKDNA